MGDGISGGFHECPYRLAGSVENVLSTEPRQAPAFGIGNFVKIVIPKGPAPDGKNLAG